MKSEQKMTSKNTKAPENPKKFELEKVLTIMGVALTIIGTIVGATYFLVTSINERPTNLEMEATISRIFTTHLKEFEIRHIQELSLLDKKMVQLHQKINEIAGKIGISHLEFVSLDDSLKQLRSQFAAILKEYENMTELEDVKQQLEVISSSRGFFNKSLPNLQMVRLKVNILDRTIVTNGSLIEVRVMKDERFGNREITQKSQLIGVCNLQNNRVQIDFREIRIKGVSYTCSGRAYDLRGLPGIHYTPLDAKTKQKVAEELKNAAVSIGGRYKTQSDVKSVIEEIAVLDEGLEFYVVITDIF